MRKQRRKNKNENLRTSKDYNIIITASLLVKTEKYRGWSSINALMSLLATLSDDPLQLIAAFLSPKDIAHFLCCTRSFYSRFDGSDLFWTRLLHEQFPEEKSVNDVCSVHAKEEFLIHAGARDLSTVKWIRLENSNTWPSEREGHLCARIGNSIVITGGYVDDDDDVYVYDLATNDTRKTFLRTSPSVETLLYASDSIGRDPGSASQQTGPQPFFVYGASLTTLDSNRAVRFGGFRSGGYSAETSQVVLLTLNGAAASWQVIACKLRLGGNPMNSDWLLRLSRAYHSATLLFDRYLLILGGMQRDESTWEPVILDTFTWTWLDGDIPPAVTTALHPSNRHGHSVIVDPTRNRLVLFGGGDGSDLLRSGKDNTEVWECPLPVQPNDLGAFMRTMWNCLHEDQMETILSQATEQDSDAMDVVDVEEDPQRLTPAEALCFGRCHSSFRVSRDKVLLLFGSGRPSTNGILGYNLAGDVFCRPKAIGNRPLPRFTCASVYLEEYAYIFLHGGFSSQCGSSIVDGCVLDLAGGFDRTLSVMVENTRARAHAALTNDAVLEELGFRSSGSRLGARSRSLLQYLQSLARREYGGGDDYESDEDSDYVPPT